MRPAAAATAMVAAVLLLMIETKSSANRAGKARRPTLPVEATRNNNEDEDASSTSSSSSPSSSSSRSLIGNLTQSAKNVTFLLDNLLKDYDNSLRPGIGGEPLMVEINMQVRSMGPISEIDMSYSMDCYFRQSWVDRRLAFSGQKNLALSIEMLRKIWKPDTYIYNGKKSYLHIITTPNKFMRLFPNGRVLYSQRLTIKAGCEMDLSDFPMDKQRCPLQIGSFGYTNKEVSYQWTSGRGVNIASDMKLSQFDLISTPTTNGTIPINRGKHSTLLVTFHLQRHMGNFVIQVYGPCILLVVISWVSFWLNREATSDRITLGVTTVLTMTFLGLEARTDLPQVSYPTALDYFVFLSFMFIFTTVVQFALVHFFTKVGGGEYYLEELEETLCQHELKRKIIMEKKLLKRLEEKMHQAEERDQGEGDPRAVMTRELQTSKEGEKTLPSCAHKFHKIDVSFVGNHIGSGANFCAAGVSEETTPSYVEDEEDEEDFLDRRLHNPKLSGSSYCTLPLLPEPNMKSNGGLGRLMEGQQSQFYNKIPPKEHNILNHHPYGSFYYNKKTGRSGRKAAAATTLKNMLKQQGNGQHQGQQQQASFVRQQHHSHHSFHLSSSLSEVVDLTQPTVAAEAGVLQPPPPRRVKSEPTFEDVLELTSEMDECGCKRCVTRAMDNPEKALNSVSQIDKISRVLFPLCFGLLNIFYWYSYLKHSERIDLSFEDL